MPAGGAAAGTDAAEGAVLSVLSVLSVYPPSAGDAITRRTWLAMARLPSNHLPAALPAWSGSDAAAVSSSGARPVRCGDSGCPPGASGPPGVPARGSTLVLLTPGGDGEGGGDKLAPVGSQDRERQTARPVLFPPSILSLSFLSLPLSSSPSPAPSRSPPPSPSQIEEGWSAGLKVIGR